MLAGGLLSGERERGGVLDDDIRRHRDLNGSNVQRFSRWLLLRIRRRMTKRMIAATA